MNTDYTIRPAQRIEQFGDGVVGVIYGRVVTNKGYLPSRTGMVDQAFVQPLHRRRGVGARLVAELCRFFVGQGIEDLSLRYVAGNEEAAGFWVALGFTPRIVTVGASRRVVEMCLNQVQSS
jgi:GNAT superfamily N-acetyltransferase